MRGVLTTIRKGLLSPSATTDQKQLTDNYIISPNPAYEAITISTTNQSEIKNIEIFNALGNNVLNSINQQTISLNGLDAGIYYVKIDGAALKKIVVIR